MIEIFTTGGTIDKVYFDAKDDFKVGESPIDELLREANLTLETRVTALLKKDSLEMSDVDRGSIRQAVLASDSFDHIGETWGNRPANTAGPARKHGRSGPVRWQIDPGWRAGEALTPECFEFGAPRGRQCDASLFRKEAIRLT